MTPKIINNTFDPFFDRYTPEIQFPKQVFPFSTEYTKQCTYRTYKLEEATKQIKQ